MGEVLGGGFFPGNWNGFVIWVDDTWEIVSNFDHLSHAALSA